MRDGTRLATDVYLSVGKALRGLFPLGQHPKTPRVFGVADRRILRRQTHSTVCYRPPHDKAAPVVLVRTPYNKVRMQAAAERFVDAGYVTVVQDCRGTHASEGTLIPYNDEGQDGYDTLEWIVDQPWCNGRVGTWGSSYVGGVQWQAAVEKPPGLVTMIPRATWSNFYRNLHLGGAARMLIIRWAAGNSARPEAVAPPRDWEAVYRHLPLTKLEEKIGHGNGLWP